ncbi:DUF1624 domain-containing protein [Methylomonas methanica]|uniref:Heparan-alpha-glucosaminide N-acetyltransferase catalytic domain-containing protein n=1 Tax=Methylomonas methanica (strain DSM 25384 / MC09) TaxID=857087 RepID=G0A2D6_METMM|nr:heparan-alpha-glucosaminide N-acetyltransferase domain-containing protein [Methylomonas methanica]AEF98948.1 hypothetical protein Metme_0504 [Methylomonas methanica MC09]
MDTLHSNSNAGRLTSIDTLRGLVMVLMTLDHTRDFFSAAHFKPTDLDRTNVALFLTRWITHFCAPTFVFLAGASAYLWYSRRGPGAPISMFLLKRGLLLIFLTCTVEAWAWNFRNDFRQIDGGVLWAIGWSMMVLAGLVKLRLRWVVSFGLLMIVAHNGFDAVKPAELGIFGPWWAVLHTGDDVVLSENWSINPYYPLVPWIGVMAVGFGFGKWMSMARWRTRRHLLQLGLTLIVLFIVLRYSNLYGDPKPWQRYPDPAFTLLSFINCHKYPPSLLYLLMTLGPAIAVLAWLEGKSRGFDVLQLFGRTPLFFYLVHLYLIHLLAVLIASVDSGPVSDLMGGGIWSKDIPEDYGYGLPMVYLFWSMVLLMLYPLCLGFEKLKAHKPHWRWLSYL